jgi:hypothetical protein
MICGLRLSPPASVAADGIVASPNTACGGGIEEALDAAMALGPTSRVLQDQSAETRAAVATSIRRALQPYQRDKQVALAGAIWLVSANNA